MDGLQNIGISMPCNHRPPRPDIVDIALTFDIEEVRPLRALNEHGRHAQPFESAYGRVHAARNVPLRTFEQL